MEPLMTAKKIHSLMKIRNRTMNNEETSCRDCAFEAKTPEDLNKHLSSVKHHAQARNNKQENK